MTGVEASNKPRAVNIETISWARRRIVSLLFLLERGQ
jgi:hypothetical protein